MGVIGFIAAQGNFREGIWDQRYTGSDNPTSFRYLGSEIQRGIYNVRKNIWASPATDTTGDFIGEAYTMNIESSIFLILIDQIIKKLNRC